MPGSFFQLCLELCLARSAPLHPPAPPTLPIPFFRVQIEPRCPRSPETQRGKQTRVSERKAATPLRPVQTGPSTEGCCCGGGGRLQRWGGVGRGACAPGPQQSCQNEIQLPTTHTHTQNPRRKTETGAVRSQRRVEKKTESQKKTKKNVISQYRCCLVLDYV